MSYLDTCVFKDHASPELRGMRNVLIQVKAALNGHDGHTSWYESWSSEAGASKGFVHKHHNLRTILIVSMLSVWELCGGDFGQSEWTDPTDVQPANSDSKGQNAFMHQNAIYNPSDIDDHSHWRCLYETFSLHNIQQICTLPRLDLALFYSFLEPRKTTSTTAWKLHSMRRHSPWAARRGLVTNRNHCCRTSWNTLPHFIALQHSKHHLNILEFVAAPVSISCQCVCVHC